MRPRRPQPRPTAKWCSACPPVSVRSTGIEPHCDGQRRRTVAVGFRDMGIPAAVWASVVPTYHLANEYSLISRTIGDAQVLARMLFD